MSVQAAGAEGRTMKFVRRQIRIGRLAAMALGAIPLVLLQATGAYAAPPNQFRTTETVSFTDDTTCSFTIDINATVTSVGRAYFDKQGNFLHDTVHFNFVGTDSANGVTLRDSAHFVIFGQPDGTDKLVGLVIHIQLLNGGVVTRDAGYLLRNPDGSFAIVHGPHPFSTGDVAEYCAAFGHVAAG
jgi:hypothetical protein